MRPETSGSSMLFPARIAVKLGHQAFRRFGRRYGALYDDLAIGDLLAIQIPVPIRILAKRGAAQGHTQENTALPRPSEDLSGQRSISFRLCRPSNRSGRHGSIAAQSEFRREQTVHP